MGEINKTTLGRLKGLIGDVVFRQRDGANYVSSRPTGYPETTDPVILARRARFKLTLKFASAINSIEPMRKIWKPYAPEKGIAYNAMVQSNYIFVNNGVIGDRAMIMPTLGFSANATSLELTETQLTAVFAVLDAESGIDENVERDIYLASVVHLSSPVVETDRPYEFLSLLSASQSVDLVNPMTFNIPLDNIEKQIFNAYQSVKIFAALYTTDANDQPVHYSTSISG